MYKRTKYANHDGSVTYYADSRDDIPTVYSKKYRVGDKFVCATETGAETWILFPKGWHNVGSGEIIAITGTPAVLGKNVLGEMFSGRAKRWHIRKLVSKMAMFLRLNS